jgi:HSP20 family molecular chaperone IbpA
VPHASKESLIGGRYQSCSSGEPAGLARYAVQARACSLSAHHHKAKQIMKPELIDVMQHQVQAIYHAVTGTDVPYVTPSDGGWVAPLEEVTRRFAELETLVRSDPFASELVPPFSFTPPLDVFTTDDQIVVELAVPGVDEDDVSVEVVDGIVIVSGFRRAPTRPRLFSHAEIPQGPFYRAFRVPLSVHPEPDCVLDRGLLRIQLTRKSNDHHEGDQGNATVTS